MVFALIASSCGLVANVARSDESEVASVETSAPTATLDRAPTGATLGHEALAPSELAESPDESAGSTTEDPVAGEPLPGSGSCSTQEIGKEDGPLISGYWIVDGQLGDLCIGVENDIVLGAWESLEEIAPPEELVNIEVFAGFEPRGTGTIAFVLPVDFDFEEFIMVIDVEEAEDDPQELRLTLAHELTHVFVQSPDQIDVNAGRDECDTYYNGFGCFLPGSYMAQWVDEFWDPEDIAALPASGGLDEEGAVDRCNEDAGFIGQYSATHPEEDFAEAFSAYVYDVRVAEESQSRYAFFDRYPELAAFRQRADDAGRLGIRNFFGRCG